jgi:hypothetical protein
MKQKKFAQRRSTFVSRKLPEASGYYFPIQIPFTATAQIFVLQHIHINGC